MDQDKEQMANVWERQPGHILGLKLPLNTWAVLRQESIMTLEQLKATIHQIHRLLRIGRTTAQLIRDELARLTASEKGQSNNE
jgi:hypothetical protein